MVVRTILAKTELRQPNIIRPHSQLPVWSYYISLSAVRYRPKLSFQITAYLGRSCAATWLSWPLVTRAYTYDDYIVNLQAWSVYAYKGTPRAMEGQVLRWVAVKELVDYEMPEANDFVMTALLQQLCGLYKP